jgi:hypothetical protein
MAGKRALRFIQSTMPLIIILVLSSFVSDVSVATDGNVSFTVKTVTYDGDRSPKNIVAIWVEDKDGNFIKTRLLQADKRKEWLLTWNDKSKGSTLDATTGATLDNHQAHTVGWDCKDESGTLVEDGEYKIVVEFTEAHSQGPLTSVTFTKGSASEVITPADETNFIDMRLEYTALTTDIADILARSKELNIYPNPFTDLTTIQFNTAETSPVELKVYNLKGMLLRDIIYIPGSTGEQSIQWDGTDDARKQLPPGTYLLQLHLAEGTISGQVIKR